MSIQQEKFKAIADRIRAHIGNKDLIAPNDFAAKIDFIAEEKYTLGVTDGYPRGYDDGESKGISEGIEQGKQAQYDEFWDVFQDNGKRTWYCYQFYNSYWNGNTFKPKYDIKPTGNGAYNMFSNNYSSPKIDLRKEALGVELDFSGVTEGFNNTFSWQSVIVAIGTIDTRKSNKLFNCGLAGGQSIHTIEKIILKEDGSQTGLDFISMNSLKNIVIEGAAGDNISFKDSPLTKESIKSVIGCLSDSVTGKTLTLKKTAKEAAFTESEWATLAATKTNWTISLV